MCAMAKTDGAMSAYVDMQYLLELKRALYMCACVYVPRNSMGLSRMPALPSKQSV